MSDLKVGQKVVVRPPQTSVEKIDLPFEAEIMERSTGGRTFLVRNGDGTISSRPKGQIVAIAVPDTRDPVRHNFHPDSKEVHLRRAIHVLADFSDEFDLVLKMDQSVGVYLVASVLGEGMDETETEIDGEIVLMPRPAGTVEYQVSDGPPGHRSTSFDFYNLKEAVECHEDIVAAGGFLKYSEAKRADKQPV